ncbi:sporulation histidine kinase inhibitor Sda [Halalkalibacter alkaliphilus]|uniref:Sporulation histidine kinase inhibitor Sda n=1 Tax=Halalkalibacter alkaliphilus TaxID=2917993 RepID=A0A9X2CRH3_9BACI|nr:sporulation histidine kinase inhibitor Sda [Halalkalibacter alkaliphilus]
MLNYVDDEILIDAYNKAIDNDINEDFIKILEEELSKRVFVKKQSRSIEKVLITWD